MGCRSGLVADSGCRMRIWGCTWLLVLLGGECHRLTLLYLPVRAPVVSQPHPRLAVATTRAQLSGLPQSPIVFFTEADSQQVETLTFGVATITSAVFNPELPTNVAASFNTNQLTLTGAATGVSSPFVGPQLYTVTVTGGQDFVIMIDVQIRECAAPLSCLE